MTDLLDRLLRPNRVALVGVSRNPEHLTARPARYLAQWAPDLDVVIVHPTAVGTLHGHPVVDRIAAAGDVDAALLLVPVDAVVAAVEECAQAGVRAAVSVASGFVGGEGAERRRRLRDIIDGCEMRLLGPNCVGLVSPATGTILSFSSVLLQEDPVVGHVGLVTQSGAIGNAVMLALARRAVGLAHWLSTGDELDVGAIELAAGLARDPSCRAVGLFLEGITDPEHLADLGAAIASTGTPVVALRSAASAAGRRAAFGHTGRVVGNDEIARSALRDVGVELVESLQELTDVLTVLSALPPCTHGDEPLRVGVVTVSGGTGVMAADAVARSSALVMADLAGDADRIDVALGGSVTVDNPLDVAVLGQPEVFPRAIAAVARLDTVDAVVAVVSSLAHDYDMLADTGYDPNTPIVIAHLSPEERFTPAQAAKLAAQRIASVPSAPAAVQGLSVWASGRTSAVAQTAPAPPGDIPAMPLSQAVAACGLTDVAPPMQVVTGIADVLAFVAAHGAVVLKADGVTIAHRADVGAVAVGLREEPEIRVAWDRVAAVCSLHGDRVIAQAMAAPGVEVMVTAMYDAEAGPALVLRPGGSFTELMAGSVVLTGAPESWSTKQLGRGPLGRLLAGWRGNAPGDVGALLDLARRLKDLVAAGGTIECNPVIVHAHDQGVSVIDVLVSPGIQSR